MFVAWEHQCRLASASFPQRLGVVYCFNRPCELRAVAWPQHESPASVQLTAGLGSAFSPRFSPDGATLVFLSQGNAVATGVHSATVTLHALGWGDAARALGGATPPPPRTGGWAARAGGAGIWGRPRWAMCMRQ